MKADGKQPSRLRAHLTPKLRQLIRNAFEIPDALRAEIDAARLEAEKRLALRQHTLEARIRHFHACGVPRKILDRWEMGFTPRGCDLTLGEFMRGERLFAVLRGVNGTGKSTCAAGALEWAVRNMEWRFHPQAQDSLYYEEFDYRRGLFISAPRLAEDWSDWPEYAGRYNWERARKVRILVLDDLGRETDDSKSNQRFANLLCEREAEKRKTVITTTLKPDGIVARYKEHLADRLAEESVDISCGALSFRRRPDLKVIEEGGE